MKATKQHFEAAARILRGAAQRITKNDTLIAANQMDLLSAIVRDFADEFTASSARFDRQRFLDAVFPIHQS